LKLTNMAEASHTSASIGAIFSGEPVAIRLRRMWNFE
jgi:hypothetical protein